MVDGDLTCWSWVAIGCFVASASLSIAVLWPSWGWVFALDVEKQIGTSLDVPRPVEEFQRELALEFESHYANNQKKLDLLYYLFQAASVLLGGEVVFWLVDLGTR